MSADLRTARQPEHWPSWASVAEVSGVRSVAAFPLRCHGCTVGAVAVCRDATDPLSPAGERAVLALAMVTAARVAATRDAGRAEQLADQLQRALDSRVRIEQAKGVVATALGVTVDDAFRVLRRHARSTHRSIRDVAIRICGVRRRRGRRVGAR